MKLDQELSRIFKEELGRDISREIEIDKYLPQEAFNNNEARAKALLNSAFDKVTKVLTLAIIEQRETSHDENRADERVVVESQLNEEEISVGTRGWWLPE